MKWSKASNAKLIFLVSISGARILELPAMAGALPPHVLLLVTAVAIHPRFFLCEVKLCMVHKKRGKNSVRATIWPRWMTIYDRAYSMSSKYCMVRDLIIDGHILITMAKLKYELVIVHVF